MEISTRAATAGLTLALVLPGCSGDAGRLGKPGAGEPGAAESRVATGSVDFEGADYLLAEDGLHLFHETLGDGAQIVVVPQHFRLRDAFGASPEMLRGRTLVFYDPRNRGRSEPVDELASLSAYQDVEDLESVRRQIGAERVALVGFADMGRTVAMYAVRFPQRVERIVQLGPRPRDPGKVYPPHLAAADRLESMGREAVEALRQLQLEGVHESSPREFCQREWAVIRGSLVGDPRLAQRIPDPCDMELEWPVNLQRHYSGALIANQRISLALEAVESVESPVLVVHGTRDRHSPYGAGRDWAYELPEARLLTLEGAAHFVWVDAPETVIPSVARFLDGTWPDGVETVERPDPRVDPADEA